MGRFALAAIACLLLSSCSASNQVSQKNQASPHEVRDGRLFGIDISHHNRVTDWHALTKGQVDFVFVKATEGLDYVDPTFDDHFRSAKEVGITRGAYHFYETDDDGIGQADWFIKTVQLAKGDLPPVVDIESLKGVTPDSALHNNFREFVERVEAHYGCKLIIYTGTSFWEHSMRAHLPGHALWIAEYGVMAPKIPPEWQSWTFWQFTEAHSIPGAEKPVDGSVFNGTLAAFQDLLIE